MHKTKIAQLMFLILGLTRSFFAIAQEETPIHLPPIAQSYQQFDANPQLDFAIDLDSITFFSSEEKGHENAIRYTLKATSKQGAINISYEGIRCDKRQKIIYAIAREDGSWTRVRTPTWSAIQKVGNHLQHATLANDFFCNGNALSGTVESIRNRIKWNRPLNPYSG